MKVNPHRPGPWISNLSGDARTCKLLGYSCVADFDITPWSLAPIAWEVMSKLIGPETAMAAGECHSINIGLYQGGNDIRVWKVWHI
jgi:hypothetical protein